MKKIIFTTLFLSVALSTSYASEPETKNSKEAKTATETKTEVVVDGKAVYEKNCAVCHVSEGKPTIAPPIFAVKNHVIEKYPERDDFVKYVTEWLKSPSADDAIMKGAISKFGLMPPMSHINDEDAKAVAEFMFDTNMELPDWYAEHYKEEHGKEPKAQ